MDPGLSDLLFDLLVVPVALGLLGFVEPCSIGASLLFLRHVEGQDRATRGLQAIVFTLTRAAFIGLLGVAAGFAGAGFADFQKTGWGLLGLLYVALGALYLTGRAGLVIHRIGPRLSRLSGTRGTVSLAVLFGLNIPACAAPLLVAVLGTAAVGGGTGPAAAFLSLGLFGLALSLPLAFAVLWPPSGRALERAADLSRRIPVLIGAVLIGLGLWSIWFGLFATPLPAV